VNRVTRVFRRDLFIGHGCAHRVGSGQAMLTMGRRNLSHSRRPPLLLMAALASVLLIPPPTWSQQVLKKTVSESGKSACPLPWTVPLHINVTAAPSSATRCRVVHAEVAAGVHAQVWLDGTECRHCGRRRRRQRRRRRLAVLEQLRSSVTVLDGPVQRLRPPACA
jgi:hypothetical protein